FTRQSIEKFIEMPLNRFGRFLQDKKHNDWKRQLPLTREILWPATMTRHKASITQLGSQSFDKTDEKFGNTFNNGSHPHCNAQSYLLCTFKNLILLLIQRQCPRGDPTASASATASHPTGIGSSCLSAQWWPAQKKFPAVRSFQEVPPLGGAAPR